VKQINVGIIGTGWCGGIRAETCATHPLVKSLHLAETRPERLAEVEKSTGAVTATADYQKILSDDAIDAVMISATPEVLHYPMARDALLRGKHVFLEKPIAIELHEADELIAIARRNALKFTIGYSQRFNPKFAYVKKCATDGTLGKPVSALVSRHIGRSLGKKITGRTKLSPAAVTGAATAVAAAMVVLTLSAAGAQNQRNAPASPRPGSNAPTVATPVLLLKCAYVVSVLLVITSRFGLLMGCPLPQIQVQ